MRVGRVAVLAASLLVATGCYRQVVQTGRTPSATVIDRPWTNTWLWGLVPAKPIDVTAQCRSGIATVVTEQSALNGVLSLLTLGIWTPRHVTITCATGSASLPGRIEIVAAGDSEAARLDAFRRAAAASARTADTIVVRF